MNKALLIGRVGRDPEVRRSHAGKPIVTFSMATSERWKDKNSGERKEQTEWHTVVCFNEGLCGVIENYVKKGSQIMIEGKIKTRDWEKDGIKRYSTEIVIESFGGALELLGSKQEGGSDREERPASKLTARAATTASDLDDEIPF